MSKIFGKTVHRPTGHTAPASSGRSWKIAIVAGFIVFATGTGYLIEISSVTSKGDQIRTLERQVADLRGTHQKMELQVAQGRSVKMIETQVQQLGMVPTAQLDYLIVTPPTVARR